MKKLKAICVVMMVLTIANEVYADIRAFYDNQSDFLSATANPVAYNPVTYDFETSSGFPAAGGYIDKFDSVNFFDATTYGPYPYATSGVQTMTGAGGTISVATLEFHGLRPIGFGFYALNLTDEAFAFNVLLDYGWLNIFRFEVPAGGASSTPVYFSLVNTHWWYAERLDSIQLWGGGYSRYAPYRAWSIDDLTIIYETEANLIPLPSAVILGGLGLTFSGWLLHRRRML